MGTGNTMQKGKISNGAGFGQISSYNSW